MAQRTADRVAEMHALIAPMLDPASQHLDVGDAIRLAELVREHLDKPQAPDPVKVLAAVHAVLLGPANGNGSVVVIDEALAVISASGLLGSKS
jgi:hypothetical protein